MSLKNVYKMWILIGVLSICLELFIGHAAIIDFVFLYLGSPVEVAGNFIDKTYKLIMSKDLLVILLSVIPFALFISVAFMSLVLLAGVAFYLCSSYVGSIVFFPVFILLLIFDKSESV